MGCSTFGLPQGFWQLGSNTSNLNVTNDELNFKILANFSQTKNKCRGNPPTNLEQYNIADTGASQNYIRVNTPCRNKQLITNVPKVILPDGIIMKDTHRSLLNLNPLLTQSACTYHIFSHIQSGFLIPIGQLCDDGCTATFTATHLNVVKVWLTVPEGNRSTKSSIRQVNLTRNPNQPPSKQQPALRNTLISRSNPDLS